MNAQEVKQPYCCRRRANKQIVSKKQTQKYTHKISRSSLQARPIQRKKSIPFSFSIIVVIAIIVVVINISMNKLIAFCTHFCLSSVYDHTGVSNVTLYSASVAAADSSSNVIIQYELKADMLYIIRGALITLEIKQFQLLRVYLQ